MTTPIYICITLDAFAIAQGSSPAPEQTDALIRIPDEQAHTIVTASGGVERQGTGGAVLRVTEGHAVRFFARSASNQFEDAVVLIDIRHARGDRVLDRFALMIEERTTIAPASATSVLPARTVQRQFQFCECDVVREGTECIDLIFAIYDRDERGQPRRLGRYRSEPRLTFRFTS